MPPSRRSASRRAPSASGHSTPSGARSCATPASPSSRWSTGRPSWPRSRPGPTRRRGCGSTPSISRLKLELGVDGGRGRGGPGRRPGRARVRRLRAARSRRPAGSTSTTSSCARSRVLEARAGAAGALAVDVPRAARRRGPGRRPGAAPAGAPAGRAGQPDLPRRRRRPVDLRLAAGRRPADPRPRRSCCPASVGSTSRSTTAARARSSSAPSGWSSTTPSASRRSIRPGPGATGRLILAPDASDETVRLERAMRTWPDDGSTRAVLARTNRELLPAVVVALGWACPSARRGSTCRSSRRSSTTCSTEAATRRERGRAAAGDARTGPGRGRRRARAPTPRPTRSPRALLGWAVGQPDLAGASRRPSPRRGADSRTSAGTTPPLTLATAHAHEGPRVRPCHRDRDGGRPLSERPSRRAGRRSRPRAYEEERRLAYVAWTRARRSLTLLYDPSVASPFLLEAFEPDELGTRRRAAPPG